MDAVNGTEKNEEGIEKAKIIAKQTKAEYPFLIPDSGYLNGRIANIQAVPETFFVDKNGNIVGETYSGSRSLEEWEEIVETELEAHGNIVGETYSGSRSLEEWEEIVETELEALSE